MKKIIALILVVVLSLCLCACGGSKTLEDMVAKYEPYASAKDILKTYGKPDTKSDDGYPEEMLSRYSEEFLMVSGETYTGISCNGVQLEMHFTNATLDESKGIDRLYFLYLQEGEGAFTQAEIDEASAAAEKLVSYLKDCYGEPEVKKFDDDDGGYVMRYSFYTTAKNGTKLTIMLNDLTKDSILQNDESGNLRYPGIVNIYCVPDEA